VADAEPLITVIIPTFRRPKLLRRAILSVLSQTFPAFQVCVYDNASDDDTQKVVAELGKTDSRIKYWCHEQNIGVVANFNYGLKEVNTPFFSFLSDDDLLLPHFFEQAIQSLASNPDVMFYAGSSIMVAGNKVTEIKKGQGRFGYFSPPEGVLEILSTGGLLWTSIVFRSEVRDSVGVLNAEVGSPIDTDFQLRIAAHHPIIIANEPSAIFSLHEGSISTANSDVRLIWPGFQIMSNRMMSDESLPLDVRIMIHGMIDKWIYWNLCRIGERASVRGDSDNMQAVAELMKRVCNKNTKSAVLLGLSKVRELSKPAYSLVSLIRRLFIFCTSFNNVLASKTKSRQLQARYGKYLHYLNDYT
jgi:glycosyltransferase involved in cell wall biosynthesis